MQKDVLFGAVATWSICVSGQLEAQTRATASPPAGKRNASAAGPTATDQSGSADIIVTARKREETLEQVPAAASAFTGEELRAFGVQSGLDLTQFTPGVTAINNGSGINNEFLIRGEGATRQNNSETGSGLYRDEMFIPGGNAGGRDFAPLDFFDVQRIEVLRGPQGSYFGRNSLGGAVNIVSEKPKDSFGAYTELRGGSERSFGSEGVLNLPLDPALSVRIGGFADRQDGGFYHSTITGDTLDREQRWGVRGQISLHPGSVFRVNLLAEHSYENSPRPEVFEYVLPVNDPPYNNPGPSGFFIDRFDKPISSPDRFERKIDTYRADMSVDLGGVTFKSITGLRKRLATSDQDVDVMAQSATQRLLVATNSARENFKRFYQDMRLSSNPGGRFFWLVGGEYTKVDSNLPSLTSALFPTVAPAGCTAAIGCTLPVLQAASRNAYRNVVSGTDDSSYALYAAVTYNLTERFSVTADTRYTIDDKGFTSLDIRRLDNPATPANEQLTSRIDTRRTFRKWTPGASIAYRLSDAANLYARVATGYRAGGFNNDPGEPNDGVSPLALPLNYDAEYVTGYEIGAKGRIHGLGRYSISAYYADKGNTLVNYAIFVGCPATPVRAGCAPNTVRQVPTILTGGSSKQYGIEADLKGNLFNGPAGRLVYRASVTWADGSYGSALVYSDSNTNPATTLTATDIKGNRQARLRDWTLTGTLGYSVPVGSAVEVFSNLQGRAELGGFEDARNANVYDDALLFSGTLGIAAKQWTLSAQVKNLFQKSYYTISPGNQFFNTQSNEPRTFMVRLTSRLGSR